MKNLWNKFTDVFGKTIFHPQYIMNSFTGMFIDELRKNGKGKLLDIGCGRSAYKNEILKYVKSYTGVDHPKIAKLYDSMNKPDFYADASRLPFSNESFDTILMLQVLEYLAQPQLALNESRRVLKKDGLFILTSPFMYPIHDGKLDHNRYTATAISELLKSAGYKIAKIKSQGNFSDFIIQSLLVFYFKKIMSLVNKGWKRILVIPFILLGLTLTPFANILAMALRRCDRKSDFPLNILAIAKN